MAYIKNTCLGGLAYFDVGINNVFYVDEVSALFPVAVDNRSFTFEYPVYEVGYCSGVLGVWVLPLPENVEVP